MINAKIKVFLKKAMHLTKVKIYALSVGYDRVIGKLS